MICVVSCGEAPSVLADTTTTVEASTEVTQNVSRIASTTKGSHREEMKAAFSRGNATQDDMQTLYDEEKLLLENINMQIRHHASFFAGFDSSGKLVFVDQYNNPVSISTNLEKMFEEFFSIVGYQQSPIISIATTVEGYKIIMFRIIAPDYGNPEYKRISIICSPDFALPHWTNLEDDWYIYTERLAG